ncbi:MAG: hypothetical protein ACREQ5_40845, partial [Candidatus Dormibacteria bacterium]
IMEVIDDAIRMVVELAHRAQAAWDQYKIQQRLPDDPRWLPQGHPWDAYNNGMGAPQARRDPQIMSAAWNDLESTLLELSYAADRLAVGRPFVITPAHDRLWPDVRAGAFTERVPPAAPVSGTEGRHAGAPDEASVSVLAAG